MSRQPAWIACAHGPGNGKTRRPPHWWPMALPRCTREVVGSARKAIRAAFFRNPAGMSTSGRGETVAAIKNVSTHGISLIVGRARDV